MADATDWATLKQRCVDHGANLVLRAETMGADVRFSLAAIGTKTPHDRIYDKRQETAENAPQYVITSLVSAALDEWWA